MGATIIVDAFWGDSGKGKVASYLAQRDKADICVRAGTGTNAGHSLYLDAKRMIKTHPDPDGRNPCRWGTSGWKRGGGGSRDIPE